MHKPQPEPQQPPEISRGCVVTGPMRHLGLEGSENPSDCSANPQIQAGEGSAQGSALAISADLRAVLEAWAELPDAVKAGIVAMVKAAGK